MWNNIAKSAEAVFSRWAVKRLCKFLLKKKLGQFILGDIDLDQLDVQLRAGTIQLSDLALNVDFLNHKLGAGAAFVVKEGSIGSLSVTMPWKDRGCEIEVEELELVLAPPGFGGDHSGLETCIPSQVDDSCGSGKTGPGSMDNTVMPVSSDVHEGVKTIAKMVKWLLTSFHVKVKKLIVALDSSLEEHEKSKGFCRILVLRMSEVQCGTCISEEASSEADAPADNLLGLNMLTNFVKFEGVALEFLEMDSIGSEAVVTCVSGTTFGECFSESCPSNGRTPVITGKDGGFSGTLKLRIPWKNGSLNIRKVHADAHIDPLVLRFQPSSIKWLLHFWKVVKDSGKNTMDHVDSKTVGSIYLTTASPSSLSTLNSSVTSNNKVMPGSEKFSFDFCSPVGKEKLSDALLPESQLISDWVPFSPSKSVKNGVEEEPDFGASVEQFFDCLDEMRNSQSALGNSGMWNWTCSVFTAITAASNLASGSIHIPPEPQHIETTLKTNFAGISVIFSLLDSEDQQSLSDLNGDKTNACSVHYLTAAFQEILLVLQVSPQQIKFKATVENIELTDNFSEDNGVPGTLSGDKQGVMIHQVQSAIHDILPAFASFTRGSRSDQLNQSVAVGSPFARTYTDRGSSRTNCDQINQNNEIKILLLKTSGRTDFQVAVNSRSTGYHFTGASSFSLQLPPVVFWVNFHLINMVLVRLQEFADFIEADCKRDMSVSEGSQIKGGSSSHGDTKHNGRRYLTALSTEERLRGNIFLPNARIILCFTSENDTDSSAYYSWSQFIALDVSSPSKVCKENVQVTSPVSILDSQKRYSLKTSQSIHLNMGNLDMYLISSPPNWNSGSNPDGDFRQKFSSENILSASNRRGDLSVISMIWQEAPGTGPLIARSAKQLATSEDIRGRSKFVGKGYEFASVTTAKDTEELSYRARQEIILSSAFILHIHLSPITIKLSSHQYRILHRLSQQAIDRLSCLVRDSISVENDSSDLQKSIIVECGSVDISVSLEPEESTKGSIQNELPGSWQSLRLQMKKIHLLTVSNIGGICGSDFLWFSHAEGSLWGSVTEVPNQEFPLVSCSNSTMGRGDGDGSNILFSQFAGSDIIHLSDPETSHVYMSITIRCSTIIAMGGRLDWFEAISGFFSLPSPKSEQVGDKDLEYSVDNVPKEFSLVLNLVDIGLSYEPYLNSQITSRSCDSNLRSTNVNEGIHKNYVACLLAASSLKLSNNKLKDHVECDYRVKVQDLGLLLCAVPRPEDAGGAYGAERLHNVGYVKIAKESHLEAILRMNCRNGLLWELECSKSNIFLETCHDTTSGLIDLVTQLQQLFAPDMEESAVHLQARWNDVQKAQESDVIEILNNDSGPSASSDLEILETKSKGDAINLMEEICEDAFHLREHLDGQSVFREPELCDSGNGLVDKEFNSTAKSSEHNLSMVDSEHRDILESVGPSQKSFPEFIEGYFLSELCSLPATSKEKQWQDAVTKHKSRTLSNGDAEKVNNGWYAHSSFKILEDHVSDVSSHFRPRQLVQEETTTNNHKEPGGNGKVRGRVVLKNINVHWRMYAGSDWHKFRRRDQESPNVLGRDRTSCLEFTLSKISCQYEVYPEGGICVSRLKLAIQEFHLSDNSADSPWKMVLGYYQSKGRPRSSSSRAFKLDLEAVRPDPSTPLEEYRLRVAMLPMVLHLHQSQLDFLISFFGGKSSSLDQSPNCYQDLGEPEVSSRNSNFGRISVSEEALLPFFQKFDLWPVLIRVDYVPCRVDLAALRGGKYVELVNLVPWKGVELQLKHVHAVGLYGWGSVCETVLGEWLEDISQNQIHKLLRGLPPIRSLVAVGSGAAKLVSLPVKNYKKDRRLLKGMQRGTIAFLRSISLEAVGLGVHLAAGAHDILLQAEYILTSVPPSMPVSPQSRTKTNVRSNQPNNVRQGVQQAYESMSDGLGKTASALVRAPLKSYQRGAGAGSAFATAVKAVPAAAMSPASAAARAVHCTLLGVRNSLDPEHKKESIEKYMGASHPRDNMRSRNHDSVDR